MASDAPTVLVVDDDPDFRTHLTNALEGDYDVITAATGEAALAAVDAADVLLLDRRLPDVSGPEVLRRVRADGNRVPVAMVTAVEPDFDIIEMGFNGYLRKPVVTSEVRSVVEGLIRRANYDDIVREYYAVVSKVASLETEKSAADLAESEAYADLTDRLETLRTKAESALNDSIERGEVASLYVPLGD